MAHKDGKIILYALAKRPSSNLRNRLQNFAQEQKLDPILGQKMAEVEEKKNTQYTVLAVRRKLVAACDHSMPRRGHGRTGDSVYWWNDQFSVLRRDCLAARRSFTHSKGDPLLREAWK